MLSIKRFDNWSIYYGKEINKVVMGELIDKTTVVAEIEKIYNEDYKFLPSDVVESVQDFKDDLLIALNTLEVIEVDLEEKATQLSQKYFPDEENIWARLNIEAHKCKSACIEMVEWLKAQKGE